MEASSDEYLASTYRDPSHPASFSGVDKLYRALKDKGVSKGQVRRWLQKQDDYSMHRFVRRRFPRQKVIVGSVDYQWDSDLIDMTAFSSDNDGYKYILVSIDILSHYLWTKPLKNKQGVETVRAFKEIFEQGDRKPRNIRSDKGQEYELKSCKSISKRSTSTTSALKTRSRRTTRRESSKHWNLELWGISPWSKHINGSTYYQISHSAIITLSTGPSRGRHNRWIKTTK